VRRLSERKFNSALPRRPGSALQSWAKFGNIGRARDTGKVLFRRRAIFLSKRLRVVQDDPEPFGAAENGLIDALAQGRDRDVTQMADEKDLRGEVSSAIIGEEGLRLVAADERAFHGSRPCCRPPGGFAVFQWPSDFGLERYAERLGNSFQGKGCRRTAASDKRCARCGRRW